MRDDENKPRAETGDARAGVVQDDELRAEEERAIAWWHIDAGRALADLARDTIEVGRLAESFGRDAVEAERLALRHTTRLVVRLLELQFTDLPE